MYFCPNCNNIFDISKRRGVQKGGADAIKVDADADDPDDIKTSQITVDQDDMTQDIPVSDVAAMFNTSTSSAVELQNPIAGGVDLYTDLITKILANDKVADEDLQSINVKDLSKSTAYKQLNQSDKEKVYNFVRENTDKKTNKIDILDVDKDGAFFVCNNCGYSKQIEDGTKIFSKISSNYEYEQDATGTDYRDMIHSNILPRTRKYICPNNVCPSQTDPSKKEAVFFRKSNSYKVIYVCTLCETVF